MALVENNISDIVCCQNGEEIRHFKCEIQRILDERLPLTLSKDAVQESEKLNTDFQKKRKGKLTIWEAIQKFHCQGYFRLKDLELYVRERITDREPNISKEEVDKRVKELLNESSTTKQLERYYCDKAEYKVEEALARNFDGKPGFLVRSLKCEKSRFSKLKNIIGEIAPNCQSQCQEGKHHNECFQMESDIILLYPGNDKLIVVLVEVKKPVNELNDNLVVDAFKQLKRSLILICSLLKDISPTKYNVKTFAAFPDTRRPTNFCDKCSKNILWKEDIDFNDQDLHRKFSFEPQSTNVNNETFLTACARIIGNGSKVSTLKDLNDWVIRYENNIEKQMILLNDDQKNVLQHLDTHPQIKNFIFCGGSGTGKTVMAIECVKRLSERYESQGVEQVIVYASVSQRKVPDGHINHWLLKNFEDNINQGTNMCVHVKTFGEICDDLQINKNDFKSSNRHSYRLPKLIDEVCHSLKEKHKHNPVILVIDEIMVFGNRDSYDWSSLSPPGCEDPKADPESNLNLILAFSPGTISRGHSYMTINIPDKRNSIHQRKSVIYNIDIKEQINNYEDECIDLPKGDSFLMKWLNMRYRNTEKIQKLTWMIGTTMGIYLNKYERHVPFTPGDFPIWIDLGCQTELDLSPIMSAVDKMIVLTAIWSFDSVLLYDGKLPEPVVKFLKSLKKPKRVMDEKYFHGGESNAVIYVGSGHLEAFSRAKLMLGIITYCDSKENMWYVRYTKALAMAVEQKILLKKDISSS